MTTLISKKTLSQKAKLLQQKSKLTYAQALHEVAKELGFKNYEHYNQTKKFKIAVFSKKGGVGKTPISRNLFIDLNADYYFRTDYASLFHKNNQFAQILPKQKIFNNKFPTEKLSVVYDLCRYTKFDDIKNIIDDIDLFILPTRAHEISEPWYTTLKKSLDELYQYNKPIIILSYGTYHENKNKNKILLQELEEKWNESKNIYYAYMHYSTIYNNNHVYNKKDIENRNYVKLPEFYLDTKAKSILQIYNESEKNKYMFRSIHKEYMQFLNLIEEIINAK